MSRNIFKKVVHILAVILIITLGTSGIAQGIVIYGRGSAHGVGMSMAGVYGMAQAGYNYQQISNFYYPGTVWSTRDDNKLIQAISPVDNKWHTLTIKEYLYRLAEEPDTWPKEGLRSTMIAARTYLWYKLERYGNMPGGQYWRHDINPATRPNIVAAVNDTTNQVLTYNGKAIVAAYSGSAGGYTAKMSDVWGGSDTPYPYLINRDSPYDSVFTSSYQWSKDTSPSTIQAAYKTVGQFTSLSIEKRTSADIARSRVKRIRINGSAGSVTDTGWNFKAKVGLKSNFFWLTPWPNYTAPPAPDGSQIVLVTAARKAVATRGGWTKLWYRIKDSQAKNVRVRIVIKKGNKVVGGINANVKATNKLAHTRVKVRKLKQGIYRYYILATDGAGNQTQEPGSNLFVVKNRGYAPKTAARKVVAATNKPARLWYAVYDLDYEKARVYLIIKRGRKTVGKIHAGVKNTYQLVNSLVTFKRLSKGTYRYYVVAIVRGKNRAKRPGSNLLIIR